MCRQPDKLLLSLILCLTIGFTTSISAQKFRHVATPLSAQNQTSDGDSILNQYRIMADSLVDVAVAKRAHLSDTCEYEYPKYTLAFGPRIYSDYRSIYPTDSIFAINPIISLKQYYDNQAKSKPFGMPGNYIPEWLNRAIKYERLQQDFRYLSMISDYKSIDCSIWDLPEPPSIPAEDYSFNGYLKRMKIDIKPEMSIIATNTELEKRHWLHVFNTGLQFSQAYVSANWYQGGSNSISLLFNFLWDVQLNPVYHPKHIFQSTLSYKLGIISNNSTNALRKYTISDDLFQYNLRAGYKAVHNWFYSFNVQFKTQLLDNYPPDSPTRTASFLSPGDLNVGLGMTYSKANAAKTLSFNASIAPIAYNLITCIDNKIDPTNFNITPGRHTKTEIGSNAEVTFMATFAGNITYNTRLFLFTSYKQFIGDWENTLSFRVNSFLTTQIYAHLRYDTNPTVVTSKWRNWMFKEILSFGLSYYFSTKKK